MKARTLVVTELVLDLEDAVVPERKRDALQLAMAALRDGFASPRVSVRINAIDTPWAQDELRALAANAVQPASIVIPKVASAEQLQDAERLLVQAPSLGLQALIETAAGITHLSEIVAASSRLEGLVLGYADLAVSLGRSPTGAAQLDRWGALQDAVLVAARTAEISAIDGPFLSIEDDDGLAASAARAADLGFDGKWAIHPSQLETIRREFTPNEEEIARARSVIDAFADANAAGAGALRLDGRMIDEPVRLAALRTLALAGLVPAEPGR
jgi:citrate lyase subunit beta/citryl-CoA lyase